MGWQSFGEWTGQSKIWEENLIENSPGLTHNIAGCAIKRSYAEWKYLPSKVDQSLNLRA